MQTSRNRSSVRRGAVLLVCASTTLLFDDALHAGVIFGYAGATIGGGSRWDAAPRTIGGRERSLDGGLRYSLQGGSFEAYRDMFTWGTVPSVEAFTTAVQQAFDAWTIVDPVSGYGSSLSFVPDLNTPVVGTPDGVNGMNIAGAEIDLLAKTDASFWNVGNGSPQGETWFDDVNSAVTLTSGTTSYPNSYAISGADIMLNSNPQATWSLNFFRRLLTHEIGHAIGLGDVEGSINPGDFIDDNYDSADPVGTLMNSWVTKVDPLNPGASVGLQRYNVTNASIQTTGVNILMESNGLGIASGNPVGNLFPLSNDDYGTRQFLYPEFGMLGDFDLDGDLDATDIDLLYAAQQGPVPPAVRIFDVDFNHSVNSVPNTTESDADVWVRRLVGTEYGDIDLNGVIDFNDLLVVAQHYDHATGGWADGNVDGAPGVNFGDLLMIAQHYNFGTLDQTLSTLDAGFAMDWSRARSTIPEPATALMIGCGTMLLLRRK